MYMYVLVMTIMTCSRMVDKHLSRIMALGFGALDFQSLGPDLNRNLFFPSFSTCVKNNCEHIYILYCTLYTHKLVHQYAWTMTLIEVLYIHVCKYRFFCNCTCMFSYTYVHTRK